VSNYSAERLYQLLPAVYRERDAAQGFPLRDLVEIVAREAGAVERDVAQLYEDWFIETCQPWVVPYVGDLIGVRGTHPTRVSGRAEVAHTLGYRRRKGTAAMLEQLARDSTGWPARVVEFFELLEATQYANHVRLHSHRTPDLRQVTALEHLSGPFETAARTAEVRRIAASPGRSGRYNIPNVGLFLWCLLALPLDRVMPFAVDGTGTRFTFNSLGMDAPLFHHPETETGPAHVAEEANVPAAIRRRGFHEDPGGEYGPGLSLRVWTDAGEVPLADVVAADLADWNRPLPPGKVAIDPVLGRLVYPAPQDPAEVRVSYHHGFSDELGGGAYKREASFTRIAGERVFSVGGGGEATINDALDLWGGAGSVVIEIRDSRTYAEAIDRAVPAGARLEIRAADRQRPTLRLTSELKVTGGEGSGFEVNGLLISGSISGQAVRVLGEMQRVHLRHCTLEPGSVELIVEAAEPEVTIERSILGPLRITENAEVEIADSILDAGEPEAAAYAAPGGVEEGGALRIARSTVIGTVHTRQLTLAENSIFLGIATAERRQEGCVRFCHVPLGSRVPRRFHCQPAIPDGASAAQARRIAARSAPRFTSLRYGDPGYCQLAVTAPEGIRRGADDGSEMGVFASLQQPQREQNLRIRLEEYLRMGLEAGLFFVT